MNLDELLNAPEFALLSGEQKAAYKTTFEQISGKNITEAMCIIASAAKNMPKGNRLTKDEQKLMLTAFLSTVPEPDKTKYQKMASVFFH